MHQKPAMLVKGLTKRYGDLIAVDHISFEANVSSIQKIDLSPGSVLQVCS
jgi:ABC-type branched-subunit amino acid transport system ATPase component